MVFVTVRKKQRLNRLLRLMGFIMLMMQILRSIIKSTIKGIVE